MMTTQEYQKSVLRNLIFNFCRPQGYC